MEIDDTLAEAHTSLAFVKTNYEWDWAGAEREFQRAIHLNPNYATARHWHAVALTMRGRFEEAVTEQKRALELDPLSLAIDRDLAWIFYSARKYDQAIEQERKTLELDPNFPTAHGDLRLIYIH